MNRNLCKDDFLNLQKSTLSAHAALWWSYKEKQGYEQDFNEKFIESACRLWRLTLLRKLPVANSVIYIGAQRVAATAIFFLFWRSSDGDQVCNLMQTWIKFFYFTSIEGQSFKATKHILFRSRSKDRKTSS